MSDSRTSTALVASILLIGCALRIWAALDSGSLWFDELATALNVRGRAWGDLLAPLGYLQVLPLGFLAGEMVGFGLFGPGDVGLRIFPLIASIASLFLFWRIACRFLSGLTLRGAVALFAVSPALVWYARKAKQYAGDVFVSLVLLLLAFRYLEGRRTGRQAWMAGAVGCVAIQFSHPAVVVAAGLFLVLLVEAWRSRSPIRPLAPLGLLWGLGCLIQVITTGRLTPADTQSFMNRAWEFAFLPAPWESPQALFWLPRTLFAFVGFIVGLMGPDSSWEVVFLGVYSILMVLGGVYLARSRSAHTMLLFTPLAVAILASAVRLIPLNGRLMIYAGPSVLLACLAGVESLRGSLGRWTTAATIALVAAPAALLPFVVSTLNHNEDARPVLRQVRERWREGDVMYVYAGAEQAMRFYGEPLGLSPWVLGQGSQDPRRLLEDVDALRGQPRAWFFYTHGTGCRPAIVRSYLETIGAEIYRIDDPHGLRGMHEAAASLYDLSDPKRLARSSAATHQLLDRSDPRCRGGDSVGARIRDRLRGLISRFVD